MNMIARRLVDDEIVDPYGGIADIRAVADRRRGRSRFPGGSAAATASGPVRGAFRLRTHSAHARGHARRRRAGDDGLRRADRRGDRQAASRRAQPSIGLEILRETGVLAHLWPELLEGIEVDQNDWHAYDVYRHNLATLDAAPAGDFTLRLAALLHDVAKPRTVSPRPDGRGNAFHQHEHVGAELVAPMLARLRLPNETVETVAHLVRQHMYSADPDAQDRTLRRFIRRIGPAHLDRLFALRWADIAGSGLPKRDDSNERFEARVAAVLAERPAFGVTRPGPARRRRDRDLRAQGRRGAGISRRREGRRGPPRAVRGGHRRPVSERGGPARRARGTLHRRAFLRVWAIGRLCPRFQCR